MTITVLLADDHTIVRDGLRYLLQAAGDLQIAGLAANGQQAVEQAILHHPNVAVIDVSMPVMDGIEATKKISAQLPEIRIIMLSMYDTPQYVERAIHAGACAYVLKDAAGDELVQAIRAVHNGQHYFSPKIQEMAKRYL